MIQFDEHIFQMGWNHQLVVVSTVFFELSPQRNWGKNVPSWRIIGFCELGEKNDELEGPGPQPPWKVQAPNPPPLPPMVMVPPQSREHIYIYIIALIWASKHATW